MDNKIIYPTLIISLIVGGTILSVYDTNEELTCRTNKPYGWDILEEHDGYYDAVCPYKTQDYVYVSCLSFRSTASYERYGCNVVEIIKESIQATGLRYSCNNKECKEMNVI